MRMCPSGEPGVLAAEVSSGGGGVAEPEPDLARTEPVHQSARAYSDVARIKQILPLETSVDISESSSSS